MSAARKSAARRGPARAAPTSSAAAEKPREMPRHKAIYEVLLEEIQGGVYKPGDRLPSEAALCERFDASRITVARAFQTLQRDGMVSRRAGSGTYVERPAQTTGYQFGLLIPDLGTTEIFEPICQGILRSPGARTHSLTWGHATGPAQGQEVGSVEATEQLCRQYIAQRVAGVFFAPSEYLAAKDEANLRVAAMLEDAGIPVVLLDRDLLRYPDRSNFDLVGIDNHRAGYVLTRHLLQAGCQRIMFATRPNPAGTVDARIAGYRDALYRLDGGKQGTVVFGRFEDAETVRAMMEQELPDGIVCANDVTAAALMQTLVSLGVKIPGQVRMVGVDDVRYARFLPTPLTSLRQDCAEIGAVAMSTMLERVQRPDQPVRDVLVRCDLVVRQSSAKK